MFAVLEGQHFLVIQIGEAEAEVVDAYLLQVVLGWPVQQSSKQRKRLLKHIVNNLTYDPGGLRILLCFYKVQDNSLRYQVFTNTKKKILARIS